MRQLVIKVLNIIDARCNHEVDDFVFLFCRKQYKLKWDFIQSARYCSMLARFGVSRQMEVPNIKFHENPSSGSRADTCT